MSIKRYLSAFLSLLLLMSLASCHESVAKRIENPVTDFEYEVYETGIGIKKYVGESDHVVIPALIEDMPVITIASSAFSNTDIISVNLPDTVKAIADFGFAHCEKLEKIDLSSESFVYIGEKAFLGCIGLKNVVFGDNISEIDAHAFKDCSALTEAILPKNLTKLGELAFFGCEAIKTIRYPKSLTNPGISTFSNAKALEEIIFEEGIEVIYATFAGCNSLQQVTIPSSVKVLGSYVFNHSINLSTVTFLGDTPEVQEYALPENSDLVIYYDPSTSGWDTTPLRDIYTLAEITDKNS